MTRMENELEKLNNTLIEKCGSLSITLANSISNSLKDLSQKDLKDILANVDSNMMLNRIFTNSFSRKEFDICVAIKEILEDRQGM